MSINRPTPATPAQEIWYTRCPVPTPLGLAAQLGWFNEEFAADGIQVNTLQETDDPAKRESHYDHHLRQSLRQGGNVPALWARARGADTVVIGLNWIDEFQGILTRPGSGILTPADLQGRRLGLPVHHISIDHGRAGALRGFLAALGTAELDAGAAYFVDIGAGRSGQAALASGQRGSGYQAVFAALEAGEVDAIFVKGARGLAAHHERGTQLVYDLRAHPDPRVRANNGAPRPITVDRDFVRRSPELVQRFLTRIVDIEAWAAAHPQETVDFIARESSSTAHWVRAAYGQDIHLRQSTILEEWAIQALGDYKDFLFQHGFLPADFDIASWVDPRPLEQVLKAGFARAA